MTCTYTDCSMRDSSVQCMVKYEECLLYKFRKHGEINPRFRQMTKDLEEQITKHDRKPDFGGFDGRNRREDIQ